jgi:6-pyruvoyltetrahydropterin/6-carboxytetrahydropterin synthase
MLTITRKLEFDAGHRIPDHNSQCRNLHGHRYTLLITLTGDVVQKDGESDNGMIMDFGDIKALANEHLVNLWDHAFIVYEKDTPCAHSWTACPTTRRWSLTACPPWKTWPRLRLTS